MENFKILIVSRSFYPMNSPRSFRTTELVKELSRQGHDVTLLTLKDPETHKPFEEKFDVTIKDLGDLSFPTIDISTGGAITKFLKRVVARSLYQLFEYPSIELLFKVKKALQNEMGYDLLISIATPYPIHWGVARVWDKQDDLADTWVADCGDPYMGQTLDSFNKMFYFKYVEKDFCRKADYISVPIEEAKEGYYPEFRSKIRVIPQGFKFDDVEIDQSAYSPHPIPTFAYAGGLIPGGRDPRAFLKYLVKQEKDFKFVLFTKDTALVKPWVEKSKGRIEIRDYIPRKELLAVLSKMDFLVNFENESPLMMPSKLIDYYITGRPVLSVTSRNIDKQAIDQFLAGEYSAKYRFKNMDRYRIENVCRRFLELCQNASSR